jgi:hypothetical protein
VNDIDDAERNPCFHRVPKWHSKGRATK